MNELEKLGQKLGIAQSKKPTLFLFLLILIIIITLPGIPLLLGNVEPSLEKILPQDVQEVQTMNDMRAQFGADMMYVLVKAQGPTYDVRDPDVLKYVDILSERIRENEYILQVRNLPDLVKQVNNGIIPESNQDIQKLMNLNPNTPSFINQDYSMTIIEIRSDTGATSETIAQVVEELENEFMITQDQNPGVSLQITGFNSIDKATFQVIIQDFQYITGFSFLFMLIFLGFYFKSIKKIIASVVVIMTAVIITLGITGYLGLTITVVTMVAAAMIMALGISYGINVTVEYYLLRKQHNKEKILPELNKNMIRALIGSSLTTSAGFLALLFGIIPAMKTLGIVLAIGISITLLISILFLPVILILQDKKYEVK
ncbi:MMPL family transporter [Candidatus Woesearchaeota archaeon]|nr:MMPL family transporter [Candidatus Woesearchaeota archaeon]